MDKKKLKWIAILVSFLIVLAGVSVYLYMALPEPSEGIVHISPDLSVESRDDVWVLTVDEMVAEDGKSFSAISYDQLTLRIRESQDYDVNMSEIKDSWSNEYWERRSKETVKMNRIIWRDVAGDEKLSIGDEIIMEKEGG